MSMVHVSLVSFDDYEILSLTYKAWFGKIGKDQNYPYNHKQSISGWAGIGEHLKMRMVCPEPVDEPFEFILSTELKNTNDFPFEGVLVVIELIIFIAEIFEKKDTIIKKIFFPGSSWSLGSYSLSEITSLNFNLKFVLIKEFDFTSNLLYCFSPPSKTPLIRFLNKKVHSNGCFQLKKNDQKIWVNKNILSSQSIFFAKMLQEEWPNVNTNDKNANELIDLSNWSDKVIISCVLHLYTGWLPGTVICEEVYTQFNIKASDLEFNLHTLGELAETANMIELNVLEIFSLMEIKKLAHQKIDSNKMVIGKTKIIVEENEEIY
ncbi:hypothetical protein HMI54_014651 [Coelomomyces lativittatus]|nr:hypothetical protein HMI56_007010 [Coelomomyces lativittatus]KAJ1513841.1 hypothetical protein HMI54_014651 [Coelomomyces lativittatus]